MKDIDSLAHTKWRCQYHIVFAPKYHRQIIYGKYKAAIGKILRRICERCDGVEIIEANACEDHIHMLVTIPPKLSVSKFMGILQREEQPDDIRPICESEIQVRESAFLVSRVLRGYGRAQQRSDKEIYRKSIARG